MEGFLHQLLERPHRQRELVVPRVVVDQDVQRREHIRDVMKEADRIGQRERLVVGDAQQNPVRVRVLDEVHLPHDLPRVGAGHADEQRHPFLDRVHGRGGDGLEFFPQQVVALAVGPGRGDDVDAVLDDPVHSLGQVVNGDGLGRSYVHGVVSGECGHHAHGSADVLCGQHESPP